MESVPHLNTINPERCKVDLAELLLEYVDDKLKDHLKMKNKREVKMAS